MELTSIIAQNITRLLEENNLTQGELSNYLEISRQTLSNYLKGTSTIDSVRLVRTALFFDVPVSKLLSVPTTQSPTLRQWFSSTWSVMKRFLPPLVPTPSFFPSNTISISTIKDRD